VSSGMLDKKQRRYLGKTSVWEVQNNGVVFSGSAISFSTKRRKHQ
jgi:hypothetical protein